MAERHDVTHLAVECLTMWLYPDREKAATYIVDEVIGDGGNQVRDQMITGLLNLSMLLVLDLAKQVDPDADPIETARRILQHRALHQPE